MIEGFEHDGKAHPYRLCLSKPISLEDAVWEVAGDSPMAYEAVRAVLRAVDEQMKPHVLRKLDHCRFYGDRIAHLLEFARDDVRLFCELLDATVARKYGLNVERLNDAVDYHKAGGSVVTIIDLTRFRSAVNDSTVEHEASNLDRELADLLYGS